MEGPAQPKAGGGGIDPAGKSTAGGQIGEHLRLLERAIDTLRDAVLITDARQPDNPIVYANSAFEQVSGYAVTDVQGRNCRFLQCPETDPDQLAIVRECVRAGTHCRVELLNARRDGTRFWNELSVSAVRDADGRVSHFIGILSDVSARHEAQARAATWQRVFEQTGFGLVQVDPTREVFTAVNPAFAFEHGYSVEELIGASVASVYPPELIEEVRRKNEIAATEGHVSFESEHLRKDGSRFPVQIDVTIVRDQVGRPTSRISYVRDITQRKTAEVEIRAARHFTEEVLENSNHGMFVYDLDLRVVACNRFVERYFGISRENAIGKTIFDLFPGIEAYRHDMYFERALRGETVAARVPRIHVKGSSRMYPPGGPPDGERREDVIWAMPTYAPHRDSQGGIAGVIVAIADVTELKRTQEELAASNDQLHRLTAHLEQVREEERKRIAREIHDELGSTITSIRMHLQAAQAEASDTRIALPPQLGSIDALLVAANQSVRRIISDLRPSVLDHLGVWAAIEWYAERIAADTGIEYKVDVAPEVDALRMDSDRITTVFRIAQEGLNNVVRHADASRVAVSVALEDLDLVLEIRDDGRGIVARDAADRDSWGLIGMNERAHRFGGVVTVGPAQGGGTRLVLRLPVSEL